MRKAGKLPRLNIARREPPTPHPEDWRTIGPNWYDVGLASERKPVIGMNAEYRSATSESPAYSYIIAGYFENVIHAGAYPLIIPPLTNESSINDVLDIFDGIILVGGADLDPRTDGYMVHPSMRLLDPRRERFDRMLVALVAARKLPVFGIGVGMQLLNVSQGGTLFFNIAEDLPNALPHLDVHDPCHRHALVTERGSLMERVYGEGEIRVNSMHHMAIDEVAAGFRATARCPDGVIEAIESVDPSWCAFGTQFHPESESVDSPDQRLFLEFVAECKQRKAALQKANNG